MHLKGEEVISFYEVVTTNYLIKCEIKVYKDHFSIFMLHHILNFFFTTINNKPCGSIDPSALCLNWEALSVVGIQDLGFSHFIILIQHQRINNLYFNSAVELKSNSAF